MVEYPCLVFDGGRLRAWTPVDAETLVEAWHDPDVAGWNPVPPEPTLATATSWIAGVAERAASRVSLDWAIESGAPGDVVGEVGLSGFNAEHKGALVGYWLLPSGRGKGIATKALSAVTTWGHTVFDLDVIVARCHGSNAASQAVAARSGYRHERSDSAGYQFWSSRASSSSSVTRK